GRINNVTSRQLFPLVGLAVNAYKPCLNLVFSNSDKRSHSPVNCFAVLFKGAREPVASNATLCIFSLRILTEAEVFLRGGKGVREQESPRASRPPKNDGELVDVC